MKVTMRTFRKKYGDPKRFKKILGDNFKQTVKPHYLKQFEETTKHFHHEIHFRSRLSVRGDTLTLYVFPYGKYKERAIWIDKGTKRHRIRPRNGKYLYIPRVGYVAHTHKGRPNTGGAHYPGGKGSLGYNKSTGVVQSIRPRHTTRAILNNPNNKRIVTNAIRRSTRQMRKK